MPLLQVENLSKTFDEPAKLFGSEQFYAVKDVSFTLNRKETLAIIGKNGSGKSTLVKMIAGITPPTSGKILFNDTVTIRRFSLSCTTYQNGFPRCEFSI